MKALETSDTCEIDFFLTLTFDRFRQKVKRFLPSSMCTCRKKMEMISRKCGLYRAFEFDENEN